MSEEKYDDVAPFEEQDLRLLKNITSNIHSGLDFAQTYDENLFLGNARKIARPILSYIKNFRALPTRRVLEEHFQSDWQMTSLIDSFYYSLDNIECSDSEFKYDLQKIKDRFKEQKISSIKEYVANDPSEYLRYLQKGLQEIQKIEKGKRELFNSRSLKNFLPEFKTAYNKKRTDKNYGRGIMTGYSFFDYVTNGLMPADMLIIGAETGAGKSMLLNNMAIQMWMQQNSINEEPKLKGHNVLYFSLEMPYESCFRRTIARIADVPMMNIRDASLNKQDFSNVNKAFNFIDKFENQFQIVDIPRGATVDQIEEIYNQVKEDFLPEIVVVDYLGLLESKSFEGDDWLKLGKISAELHEFARTYNIILLTAVQLNRAAKGKDSSEAIGIHRIGRSSLILHHATHAIQIESRKDENTYSDLKYHLIKCRDGELGHHYLVKNFRNASLKDMPEPFEPSNNIISLDDQAEDISDLLDKYEWNKNSLDENE